MRIVVDTFVLSIDCWNVKICALSSRCSVASGREDRRERQQFVSSRTAVLRVHPLATLHSPSDGSVKVRPLHR